MNRLIICFPLFSSCEWKSLRWNSNVLKTKITLARNIEVNKQSAWQSVVQFVLKMDNKTTWKASHEMGCTKYLERLFFICFYGNLVHFSSDIKKCAPHRCAQIELQSHKIHTRSQYHKTRAEQYNMFKWPTITQFKSIFTEPFFREKFAPAASRLLLSPFSAGLYSVYSRTGFYSKLKSHDEFQSKRMRRKCNFKKNTPFTQ